MSNWNYTVVRDVEGENYNIRKCVSKHGDSHSGKTFKTEPVGLHWLSKGSVFILNSDGDKTGEFGIGERIIQKNKKDYKSKRTILISKENTTYFCLCDKAYRKTYDGDIITLKDKEIKNIDNIKEKRIYVNVGSIIIKNKTYTEGSIVHIKTENSISITSIGNTILAIFFEK